MEALSYFFSSEFRVYYEDTDSGGVVYYANYLKFAERARTEALREQGVNQSELKEQTGLFFIVKSCNINFVKPARLDDVLIVKTLFKKVAQTSTIVVQHIYTKNLLLAEIEVVLVCVKENDDKKILPFRLPNDIATKLRGKKQHPDLVKIKNKINS
jgi:acyl-CoA thioester hydrolase